MLTCLKKSIVTSNPNRHYKRIRIKPIGKWYYCKKRKNNLQDI
jgi:hypothetical protein